MKCVWPPHLFWDLLTQFLLFLWSFFFFFNLAKHLIDGAVCSNCLPPAGTAKSLSSGGLGEWRSAHFRHRAPPAGISSLVPPFGSLCLIVHFSEGCRTAMFLIFTLSTNIKSNPFVKKMFFLISYSCLFILKYRLYRKGWA